MEALVSEIYLTHETNLNYALEAFVLFIVVKYAKHKIYNVTDLKCTIWCH